MIKINSVNLPDIKRLSIYGELFIQDFEMIAFLKVIEVNLPCKDVDEPVGENMTESQ